ncbi:MAG: nucleoside deaminase [Spirochaetia bacterium]|nr:nucleoside deaminase [Spirochaetia bacterium]
MLALAETAALSGEVPVGAVVCNGAWEILGRGANEILKRNDPTAHAELLAIRAAAEFQKSERLSDCVLVSSLEPCTLCSGAAVFARVKAVFYFAPVFTGVGMVRLFDVFSESFNHRPPIIQVTSFSERASRLLKDFFAKKRRGDSKELTTDELV